VNGAQLLEFLVSIPSVSGHEQKLADLLSAQLQGEGFAVQRDGGNLWFSLGASDRPHLLLVSHLDTVPECAGWQRDAFPARREGDKLIGLGANDAKGCVAAMILAARELQREPIAGRVTLAFVTQEECGGDGIRATRPRLGTIDAAIIGEPTALQVCAAQRGMLILRCIARGESAHVAHAELGDNAIHKAARDIERLAAMKFEPHPQLGTTTAQITQISGGLARNQVPDACEFFVDLRTTPNLEHDVVAAEIAAALESEVTVHSMRYEPVATAEGEPIVQAALQANGHAASVGSATASDWAFLRDVPAVKAGPGDTNRSHRPDEYLLFSELEAGAEFYAQLSRNYFALTTQNQTAHA
jgi:acetylornithine deacetylase